MGNNLLSFDGVYTDDPHDDWVAVHAKCTAKKVFDQLKNIVQKDCNSANEHTISDVSFNDYGRPNVFRVVGPGGGRTFSIEDAMTISVTDIPHVHITTVTVYVDGLTHKIQDEDGELLSIPKFSKKILFHLFFPGRTN